MASLQPPNDRDVGQDPNNLNSVTDTLVFIFNEDGTLSDGKGITSDEIRKGGYTVIQPSLPAPFPRLFPLSGIDPLVPAPPLMPGDVMSPSNHSASLLLSPSVLPLADQSLSPELESAGGGYNVHCHQNSLRFDLSEQVDIRPAPSLELPLSLGDVTNTRNSSRHNPESQVMVPIKRPRAITSLRALAQGTHGAAAGERDCPLVCGFRATTKNPYRHLQDHLGRSVVNTFIDLKTPILLTSGKLP